jgi:hypothetical protein
MKKILITILFCLMAVPAWADYYYIGQWEWVQIEEEGEVIEEYWAAPQREFQTGGIDLRSIPQMSKPGGPPEGYAIFSYSQQVTDPKLTYLGDNLDEAPNVRATGAIAGKLGITPSSSTIRDIIYELLTTEADPTGKDRWKPLMPDRNLNMKIYLGREGVIKSVKLEPWVSPEWRNVLAVHHENYRQWLKTETPDKIGRALDFLEEKYGVSYQYFIAPNTIRLASLPHQTTITDDFDCANSDTLGCDLTWTELSGDQDIQSNQLFARGSGASYSQAVSDLSSDDHYVQIDGNSFPGSNHEGRFGVMGRMSEDSLDECYLYWGRFTSTTGHNVRLRKRVSGTESDLSSDESVTDIRGTYKIEIDGSNITGYLDDVEELSVSDTSITGNLRTGAYGVAQFSFENAVMDNFEAGDLGAADGGGGNIIGSGVVFSGVQIDG